MEHSIDKNSIDEKVMNGLDLLITIGYIIGAIILTVLVIIQIFK